MFADIAKVFIKSGKGGNGHVSFRRELYVPAGGPDGGDGGKGGDIIVEVDKGLNTLEDFRNRQKYIATSGEEGGGKRGSFERGLRQRRAVKARFAVDEFRRERSFVISRRRRSSRICPARTSVWFC